MEAWWPSSFDKKSLRQSPEPFLSFHRNKFGVRKNIIQYHTAAMLDQGFLASMDVLQDFKRGFKTSADFILY